LKPNVPPDVGLFVHDLVVPRVFKLILKIRISECLSDDQAGGLVDDLEHVGSPVMMGSIAGFFVLIIPPKIAMSIVVRCD
jgi:hypothetical protein